MGTQLTLPIRENNPRTNTKIVMNADAGATQTELDDLRDAILGVIHGLNDEGKLVTTSRVLGVAASTTIPTGVAQSGNRWRCFIRTATDKTYFEIPTANGGVLPTGSDYLDLSAGVGAALKTAVDAVAAIDGVAASLYQVKFVNRKAY